MSKRKNILHLVEPEDKGVRLRKKKTVAIAGKSQNAVLSIDKLNAASLSVDDRALDLRRIARRFGRQRDADSTGQRRRDFARIEHLHRRKQKRVSRLVLVAGSGSRCEADSGLLRAGRC